MNAITLLLLLGACVAFVATNWSLRPVPATNPYYI
jgi:hypothetical protein